MNRAVRDQEQIVPGGRMALHKTLDLDRACRGEAVFKRGAKCLWIDAFLKAQVHARARLAVENVIGFVLREPLAEMAANVIEPRVALHRQIAAAHRVEKVETDRELYAEALGRRAQHRRMPVEHQ